MVPPRISGVASAWLASKLRPPADVILSGEFASTGAGGPSTRDAQVTGSGGGKRDGGDDGVGGYAATRGMDARVRGGEGGAGEGERGSGKATTFHPETGVVIMRRSRWTLQLLDEWWGRRWTHCGGGGRRVYRGPHGEHRHGGVHGEVRYDRAVSGGSGDEKNGDKCERRTLEGMLHSGWDDASRGSGGISWDASAMGKQSDVASGGSIKYAAARELSSTLDSWREGDFAVHIPVESSRGGAVCYQNVIGALSEAFRLNAVTR